MTGDEIKKEFRGPNYGIAIAEGNLIKGFDSTRDLSKL